MLFNNFQNDGIDIFVKSVILDILFVEIVCMQTMLVNPEFEKCQKSQFLNSRPRLSEVFRSSELDVYFYFLKKRSKFLMFFFHFFDQNSQRSNDSLGSGFKKWQNRQYGRRKYDRTMSQTSHRYVVQTSKAWTRFEA